MFISFSSGIEDRMVLKTGFYGTIVNSSALGPAYLTLSWQKIITSFAEPESMLENVLLKPSWQDKLCNYFICAGLYFHTVSSCENFFFFNYCILVLN